VIAAAVTDNGDDGQGFGSRDRTNAVVRKAVPRRTGYKLNPLLLMYVAEGTPARPNKDPPGVPASSHVTQPTCATPAVTA
jgi:hypothetical protein